MKNRVNRNTQSIFPSKLISLVIIFFFVSFISIAQDIKKDDTDSSLPKKEEGKKRAYWGSVNLEYQYIGNQSGFGFFVSGGTILKNKFYFGIGGGGGNTLPEVNKSLSETKEFYYSIGYAGGYLGYDVRPTKPLHINFSLLLGYGVFSYYIENKGVEDAEFIYYDAKLQSINDRDEAFVIRPSVGAEFEVTKRFRIGLELADIYGINNSISILKYPGDTASTPVDISFRTITTGLSLKFGSF